ncbi:SNF2-related protein [Mycolicibacterium sp.]|uniref:SNF2-related protein n=1 Tax=Mycolicibacterium sp. TaxID=2320850 RepID=UPI003D0DD4FC
MLEKRITHQLLESGELSLTEREREALTLPAHSTTLALELDGETFHTQWSGKSRQLTGDMLTERMQDYGQDGGLLRLRQVGDVYRLQLLPPGSPMLTIHTPPPVTPIQNKTVAAKVARRRTVDRQFHADNEYDWSAGGGRAIGFLRDARVLLSEQLKAAGFDDLELVELRLQGEELATLDDFEELLAVDVANVDRMPHQEAVARHALSRLRGRAVLADEVGLGKTIEAGLAVKELTLRGLARRVLILCPAPLREQWREEMHQKFDLNFEVALRGPDVHKQDKLIMSLQLGLRSASKLTAEPWDIVIVDEAHRAAGAGARKTREFITSLTTACRYALFLTATPVQNDLLELYRLVELLRPGTFTSVQEFKRQFMRGYDPRTPNDPAALRRLISSAMIRTTRAQAGVDRVTRRAVDVPVTLGPRERELYALCTNLLRSVMTNPSDTMRRRSLALRLTASPFSMGTTALRMAERHPDPKVRAVLTEVGHLAMDINDSARENTAVEITHKWLKEHGRVLIFTQHTDTVTGLLRRMQVEGITARSFHGSMSAGERAATIAAFRSGEAPVMISTDAGAEGQNLQFCNCVLNFDLPWNPMRIEQRIGRVDRLTQPKDEVFIANLYAQGTIDESVYRLLAEKLRMFELLFGQVTTILGELDDSKSASFETRILEALFADNDKKMQNLLGQLGTELAQARESASTLIAADSGLSNWMASAFEHRKGLSKAGSSDLAPEVSERARMRQRRVQTWTRNVLKALGAELLHDTGEGDGAFITAQFDEEYEQELDGRTLMHLAFDRIGMEHHPDAELCAVGSPVFDEILGLLRMRGDMHATVPVVPDDIGDSPLKRAANVTLLRRRLVPSGSWSGQATFRAAVGESETTEHLLTADINGHHEVRLPRRPLQDGETLPAAFGTPTEVIAAFEKAATSQLEKLRRDLSEKVEADQSAELTRIRTGYTAQIYEASYEDSVRLQRALDSEEKRLSRVPDVRARAKILALTLDEDDWLVEETWTGPNGAETTLTYEWEDPEPPLVESDASGDPIEVLALCSDSHCVDESETQYCESCNHVFCGACGADAVFADCPVCGLASCGACRAAGGGLCRGCASPQRVPELDSEFVIGWRLNGGTTLLVGNRVAELHRPDGQSHTIVRNEDIDDPNRKRMRSYALRNGLPLDCGVTLRKLTGRRDAQDGTRARLSSTSAIETEFSIASAPGSAIDAAAVSDIPKLTDADIKPERAMSLGKLLHKLRSDAPPPAPPTVMVTRRSSFTDVYLEADGLAKEVSMVEDDGSISVADRQFEPMQWTNPTLDSPTIGHAVLDGIRISLQSRNEAVLVALSADGKARPDRWAAYPDGRNLAYEISCFDYLNSIKMPGGRLGKRINEVTSITEPFPSPSECSLVGREIHTVAEPVDLEPGFELESPDDESLDRLGLHPNRALARATHPLPTELSAALLTKARRPFTASLRNGLEVKENWRGHGTGTFSYRTFDGKPRSPLGLPDTDFGVCRDGHFYPGGTAALCGSCCSWACPSCDELGQQALSDCPGCSAAVCRRCLATGHTVSTTACVLCGDHSCADCGRDPEVAACPMCDRAFCTRCRVEDTCPACAQLGPATADQIAELPSVLALAGASVRVGTDADATIVLINRGESFEQAIIRNGSVGRWTAFGRNMIDDHYRLRLSAARSLSTQVLPALIETDPEVPLAEPHVLVQTERSYRPSWSVSTAPIGDMVITPPGDKLISLVSSEFPPLAQVPEAGVTTPNALSPVFRSMPKPVTGALNICWERFGFDIAITSEGLREVNIERSVARESLSRWAPTEKSPSWVSADWEPVPTVRAYAAGGRRDAEAVIVQLASLVALGVRVTDRIEWYAINESENAAAATALSRWMGLQDADEVSTFTNPSQVKLSAVTNAAKSSVTIEPAGTVTAGPRVRADISIEANLAWEPPIDVRTPELAKLPERLRTALLRVFHPAMSWSRLEIGARVEQIVTVANGDQWRYEHILAAGQTEARRVNASTGHLFDSGAIDREGHFGTNFESCRYCGGTTCAVCLGKAVACDACAVNICKRCVSEPHANLWLCPACTTMRPPTRSEAREHGRLLSTRRMLIGTDAQHTVVVERSKNHWTRKDADGEKQVIANPSVNEFLGKRLADAD